MTRPYVHPIRPWPSRALCAAFIVVAAAGAAPQSQRPATPPLRPAEQGVEDVSLLRTGARIMPLDLRQPSGFDSVYRVPGSPSGVPGMPGTPDQFARASGSITAVFPLSAYALSKRGVEVLIPAGTIFHIGALPGQDAKPVAPATPGPTSASTKVQPDDAVRVPVQRLGESDRHAGPVDLRVPPEEDRAAAQPAAKDKPAPDRPAPTDSIFADETYRRLRIRQLLMSAARVPTAEPPTASVIDDRAGP